MSLTGWSRFYDSPPAWDHIDSVDDGSEDREIDGISIIDDVNEVGYVVCEPECLKPHQ